MIERIANPNQTKAIIERHGFSIQKKYGQNFLIDGHIIEKIMSGAELSKEAIVIEIGPGIGGLTQQLLEKAKHVIAIEIDKMLIPILKETLSDYDNLTLIHEDILKVDLKAILEPYLGQPIHVIANLPYYITTPIIMSIFEAHVPVSSVTIMIQKEVAERIDATPGTKQYGALSLAVAYYAKSQIVAHVPPNCFIPRPKVGSAVIVLKLHQISPIKVENDVAMFKLIRSAFNQRRKTLVNAVSNTLGVPKDQLIQSLETLGINPQIRGEALDLEAYAKLTNQLIEKKLL